MQGIKNLNIVRYQNPRQGSSYTGNFNNNRNLNKMGSSDVNHSTQYGGMGGYYKRQNSANKTGGLATYERRESAKGNRRLRASGEPNCKIGDPFFDGNLNTNDR